MQGEHDVVHQHGDSLPLRAHADDGTSRWANEDDAFVLKCFGELGVLAQETIPRVCVSGKNIGK